MKLLFLGASSFTGYHFVKKISKTKKYKIYCTLTKNLSQYNAIRLERIKLLSKHKIAPSSEFFRAERVRATR